MASADPFPDGLRPARRIALLAAISVLWLVTRRYFGTVFDARFYMVEGLRALHPADFAKDLYFQFGSQGNFSAFTKLYLPLLPALGVGTTSMILTITGQVLWLFGLFRLARALVGGRLAWLSVAMVIGILPMYGGGFVYGEGYLTARLFAEAFVMMGLSLLPTRPFWAIAVLLVAAILHPLMALPGLAIAFVWLALGQPRWWLVMAGGAGLVAVLGLAGITPFANLFRTVDPEWFAVIAVRSRQCLMSSWPVDYFVQALTTIAWAMAALVLAGPQHRRIIVAALLVGVGGLACTYLGGDLSHNFLMIELQPWRAMWLLQLASRIYVPVLLSALLARTSLDNFRWTVLLTAILIASGCMTRLLRYPGSADFQVFSFVMAAAALTVMATSLLSGERRIVLAAAITGAVLVPAAVSQWDARSPWIRYLESPAPPPPDLAALMPAGASVYWESGMEMLWLRLKRASYFSCDQGTGSVFYRQTAMTYKRRANSFWPLRTGDFNQLDTCAAFDKRPGPQRNRQGLQALCRREPGLDLVILAAPLDGVATKVWKSPVRFQDLQSSRDGHFARVTDRFYIYSCAQMR